ncbi:hypothetical protein GCM10017788_61320 [Amycolatopsis acidiphila]|nr:hypothetical protein GCM10017788_61320 [Amycolatopsis acidiphila]
MSPVDPKSWVTPERQPATDPQLLPGQLTGWLRVEDLGVRRVDEPGPFGQFVIQLRLSNHGPRPVDFAGGDEVDVQLWDINGNVVGSETTWDHPCLLPPNSHIVTAIRICLIDNHCPDQCRSEATAPEPSSHEPLGESRQGAGAVTSSPVGGMTALLACSRALRGARE